MIPDMSIPASLAQPSRPSLKLYTAKRSAKSKATLTFHKKHSLFLCRASPNRRKIEGGSQSAVGFGKDLKKRSGSSNDQTNGERIETSHEADETSQIENSVDTGESVRSKVTGNVKGGDVAREQVLGVCVRVSLTIALVGVIVRQLAFNISPAASDGHEEELIRLLNGNLGTCL